MRPPAFWLEDAPRGSARLTRALLSPLGALYNAATQRRLRTVQPYESGLPVICIGNLTLGGTGKTPVARAVAARLEAMGEHPAMLSRGYKGRLDGPVRVDPAVHGAGDVGDVAHLAGERQQGGTEQVPGPGTGEQRRRPLQVVLDPGPGAGLPGQLEPLAGVVDEPDRPVVLGCSYRARLDWAGRFFTVLPGYPRTRVHYGVPAFSFDRRREGLHAIMDRVIGE